MHLRLLKPKHGPTLLARPLRHGDVRTVMSVFERLGEGSRRARFNGPKPCLSRSDLRQLASVDSSHHVLVAYVEGDPQPVAIARLVREGGTAEIAFAVADARAAGITEITALVSSDNAAAVALLRRIAGVLAVHFEGRELSIRAAIA